MSIHQVFVWSPLHLLLLIALASTNCVADSLEVGPSKTYQTIQAAINAASSNDTILVDPGSYPEDLVISKSLTLIGPNNLIAALPESGWTRGSEAEIGSDSVAPRITINGNVEVHVAGFKFIGPATGDAPGIRIYEASGSIRNNWFFELTNSEYYSDADICVPTGAGTWRITGNRHDSIGYSYGETPGEGVGTYAYSAINAWNLDEVEVHGNRIENYGFAGVQLEKTMDAVITSNYIKDVAASGIQVGPYCMGKIVIKGNTIDHASACFESAFAPDPIDADYGWAGIRIWQVASSDGLGTDVLNNLIINTPQRVGAIGFLGSSAQTLGMVESNSIGLSNSDGLLSYEYAVRATQIASGIATIRLWAGDYTEGGAINQTNHAIGDNVIVTGLGPSFDGTHTITDVGAWEDSYHYWYKEISFSTPQADQAETDVYRGAAASEIAAAVPIPAAKNYWGGGMPDGASASLNSSGAAATVSPWIKSYTEGSAPEGFIAGIGFWPANIVLAPLPTTLTYDGPFLDADGVAGSTLFATLSCSEPDCVAGQTVVFTLNGGSYTVQGTTNSSGKVAGLFDNLPPGVYSVRVDFAGSSECAPSYDEGTLTVTGAGDSANGGGWYKVTQSPVSRASVGFVTQSKTNKRTGVTTVTGELVWIYHKHYRLKSTSIDSIAYTTVSGYTKSAQLGGWGVLSQWIPDLENPDGGYWEIIAPVAFVATVCDGGQMNIGTKKKPKYVDAPDAFGIQFPATGVDLVPGESAPIVLSGGQIKVK